MYLEDRGDHLEQDSVRQTTIEGIDGGMYLAVDGPRLSKVKRRRVLLFVM